MRILALVKLFLFMGCASISVHAQDILIENISIVSPGKDISQNPMNVLISNGRIVGLSDGAIAGAEKARKIDGSGKFLTPGLMDSHVHVSSIPGIGISVSDKAVQYAKLVEAYLKQQPRSYLYHGVTQILDPSPLPDWTKFTSQPVRPDFFRCGSIPNIGGYPQVEADDTYTAYPHFVIEGDHTEGYPEGTDLADHTPEAIVNRIADEGAICVKTYIEDGFGAKSEWPILSDDSLGRITKAAHDRGMIVLAHANAIDMQRVALRNNVDVMAHGLWNWQWPEDKGPMPLEDTLNKIIESKIGYMPTFRVMAGMGDLMAPDLLTDPAFAKVTPKSVLKWYYSEEADWFRQELLADFGPGLSAEIVRKIINKAVLRGQRAAAHLHEKGHPMLLASDYPSSPSYANQAGLTTFQEMKLMSGAGIPLKAIFEAATINNARQFGLDKDYGTIEQGKIANLLILKSNPLDSIDAWDTIDVVILKGVPHQRDSFLPE